jgi:hypothetical protein
MDRDGMSNLYRGPSTDASYQVSVHLAKWLQKRRIFKISQSETRVAYGHRQFMFTIVCFLKKTFFFWGKGDNSNLNIDISKNTVSFMN